MADSIPPPGLPNIVPPGVMNAEINIANKPPLSPVPPDVGFDDWTVADTERIVAMSGCSDDQLRACIVAASSLDCGVQEMYTTQIDSVFCLLHPVRSNNLAVIQQTGAGKTHILRTLGVMDRGLSSLSSHSSPSLLMWCQNSLAPTNRCHGPTSQRVVQ